MKLNSVRYILLPLMAFFLCACNEVSVTGEGLSHKQANRIIAVLSAQGIPATAEKSGRKSSDGYHVLVKHNKYLEAVQILDNNGLPEEEDPSLKYLSSQGGFLSSNSKEIEALRADRALAVQIEDLFSNHAGVISAKAIVRQRSVMADSEGAAIIVRLRKEDALSQEDIEQLVQLVLPNIPLEKVKVISTVQEETEVLVNGVTLKNGEIVKVPLVSLLFWNVVEGDQYGLIMTFFAAVLLSGFICATLGYLLANFRYSVRKKNGNDIDSNESDLKSVV
jgi:type III secretory pathway lipoprotein EscJ